MATGFFAKLFRRTARTDGVRRFDAAGGGRRWHAGPSFGPINAEVLAARAQVQSRALYHARNSGWLAGAIRNYVTFLIGDGLIPGSQHPDPTIRADLQRRFTRWAMRACVDGRTTFWALQAQAARAMLEAGEVFWQMVTDTDGQPRVMPIPAERCDASMSRELSGGGKDIAGIRIRGDGAIAGYWFLPDADPFGTFGNAVFVDGSDTCHFYEQLAPGQMRGISALAPILLPAQELDQTEDAIAVGLKVAAMHCGFLTDINGSGGQLFEGQQTGSVMESGLEPGTLKVLPAGVDVKFSTPNEAAEAVAFLKYSLRGLASGLGVPMHLVDGDLSDANYSSLRAGNLAFYRRCSAIQQHVIIPQLTRVWERWVTLEVLSGRMSAPDFERAPDDWLSVSWTPPAMPSVDPSKDTEADVLAVNNGFTSRASVIRARGSDPERVDAEVAADRDRARAAGLAFPFPAPASTSNTNREAADA